MAIRRISGLSANMQRSARTNQVSSANKTRTSEQANVRNRSDSVQISRAGRNQFNASKGAVPSGQANPTSAPSDDITPQFSERTGNSYATKG